MIEPKRPLLGIIAISVIMFFVALATNIFWVGRLAFEAFPSTMPVEDRVYNAFAAPDIILSIFLYIGAWGLLRLRKFGFIASYVAMGMWLFDSVLVLGITGLTRISIIGPILFFVVFTLVYLWNRRDIFQ
ncbi:MAG: hypothetical protein QHH14_12360 [Clostridiales bacterium]|nr:hypothetical protein [Clostridiales bacterium]